MKNTCGDCIHWKHRAHHGDNVGVCRIADSNSVYVTNDTCLHFKADEHKANMTLFAAAPEMYDILEHYFDLIQRADYGDILAEQKIFEDIVYIEEVLKKARGEE